MELELEMASITGFRKENMNWRKDFSPYDRVIYSTKEVEEIIEKLIADIPCDCGFKTCADYCQQKQLKAKWLERN